MKRPSIQSNHRAGQNQDAARRQSQDHSDWWYELQQIQEFLASCTRLGIALSDTQKKQLAQRCESAILHHTPAPECNLHGGGKLGLLDESDYRSAYLMVERMDHQKDIYDDI